MNFKNTICSDQSHKDLFVLSSRMIFVNCDCISKLFLLAIFKIPFSIIYHTYIIVLLSSFMRCIIQLTINHRTTKKNYRTSNKSDANYIPYHRTDFNTSTTTQKEKKSVKREKPSVNQRIPSSTFNAHWFDIKYVCFFISTLEKYLDIILR